jgi:hypothetical protein
MPVTISTQMRGGTHNKLYGPEWGPWTTQQSTAHDMTVTATAKAMVVRSTKDDKADVMHDLMGTMHRTDGIGTMARAWHML